MNIGPDVLRDEVTRALRLWPFIPDLERTYELPAFLLPAVGSVETNLSPAYTDGHTTGDGGHGHGVMQLDDRSHVIPAGFDADAHAQFETAAQMLSALLDAEHGDVVRACNRYNSGSPSDKAATHGTGTGAWVYGREVADRLAWLTANLTPPPPPAPPADQEDDMPHIVGCSPPWAPRQPDGADERWTGLWETPTPGDFKTGNTIVASVDNAPFTPPWHDGQKDPNGAWVDFQWQGLWWRRWFNTGVPITMSPKDDGRVVLVANNGTYDVARKAA